MKELLVFPASDLEIIYDGQRQGEQELFREKLLDIIEKVESGVYLNTHILFTAETVHDTLEIANISTRPHYGEGRMSSAYTDGITIKVSDNDKLVNAYEQFTKDTRLDFLILSGYGIAEKNEVVHVGTSATLRSSIDLSDYKKHSSWSDKKWAKVEEQERALLATPYEPCPELEQEYQEEMEHIGDKMNEYREIETKNKLTRKDKLCK